MGRQGAPSFGLWPGARAVGQPEQMVTHSSSLVRVPGCPLALRPRTWPVAPGPEMQPWSPTEWSLRCPLFFYFPHSGVTGLGWGI